MSNITSAYQAYYKKQQAIHVYPVEFVVRTLLGSYKNLSLDKSKFLGSRILDLGYGDARNMPLLSNLGFEIHGLEISDEINNLAQQRLSALDVSATLKTGHNTNIPYPDSYFQYILACHSCYYVRENESFTDTLNEISRVLDSNGIFICSLPFNDTYILHGAEILADGHYRIQNDPYQLRNGTIFRAFSSRQEIIHALENHFTDFRIGFCNDDFYGIHQKVWIVTCWKK